MLLEYPEFGIYDYSLIKSSPKTIRKEKKKIHNSAPLDEIDQSQKLIKPPIFPEGIVKQIYKDLETVFNFIDNHEDLNYKKYWW